MKFFCFFLLIFGHGLLMFSTGCYVIIYMYHEHFATQEHLTINIGCIYMWRKAPTACMQLNSEWPLTLIAVALCYVR